ncbi:hypothetical protein FRB96_006274 [Tulasnella sp. 330]|nr:hypothetical protein FRB96_006274 [Tulasnella sp. 330]
MSASNNPRILPAPTRPTDSSTPGTPADPYPPSGPSKRRSEASNTFMSSPYLVIFLIDITAARNAIGESKSVIVKFLVCVARKVPELCKNYQPGKQEDFNARLSRIEQIIELALPQFAAGEYTTPSSPQDYGVMLPPSNGEGYWVPGGNEQYGMELDGRYPQDGQKSASSSRSGSPKLEDHAPAGGMLESGRWYGTSALGSVYSRPILEQLQSEVVPQMIEDAAEVNDKLKSLIQECGVSPHKLFELVQELPPKSLSDVLINYYFTFVNYTRYPLYEPSFRASYDSVCNNGTRVQPHDIRFLPLLFVVLAIAARLAPENILGDDRQKRLMSLRYYWSSRRSLLIAAAVQTDSFEVILTRLLSARFLTFDRRITECWAQLGAAVRTAQALGLHRDPSKMGLDPLATEYRRRIWAYLYHADSTFALLLGRPRTIHDNYCDTMPPSNVEDSEIIDHMRHNVPPPPVTAPHLLQFPSLPPLQAHPLSTPTHMTYPILRHALAVIIGHIVHHFQQVRHHSHYSEVLSLDEELQRFVKNLPPHFSPEPDMSLDETHPFIPVHRFLITCEVYFVRISLHRPYILRKLNSDRFAASRQACIDSARKDFEVRQAFKRSMPLSVISALGGAYREFQSAMISGIALVIDPHGSDSAAMHEVMDTFLSDHGVGEGVPPVLKEVDETTRRELKIIQFLSEKAKNAEKRESEGMITQTVDGAQDGDGDEDIRERGVMAPPNGDKVSAERTSARLKRKKSSRSITTQEAGLLLGISSPSTPLSGSGERSATAPASSATSPFAQSHSRTPSSALLPSSSIVPSPTTQNHSDLSIPTHPLHSPVYTRLNSTVHTVSPLSGSQLHLSHLAQRQVGHDARSLASSSPSAEDESAQRLLDNWCNNVNATDAGPTSLARYDPNAFNLFAAGPGGGPMWNGALPGYPTPFHPNMGLGLMNPAGAGQPEGNGISGGLGGGGPTLPGELGGATGEGVDYMVWDALVQQIRGGSSITPHSFDQRPTGIDLGVHNKRSQPLLESGLTATPREMHWTIWVVVICLAAFVLKNYGIPWIVRHLSSNVRIRNTGLRSVRGLFLKIGGVTLTADRIALTIHRSGGWLRVGLDFQNVVISLAASVQPPKRNGWAVLRQRVQARPTFSIASLAEVIRTRSRAAQPSKAWLVQKMVTGARATSRLVAFFFVSLIIRSLPALTQSFDIQMDQIVLISEDMKNAHVVVRGVVLTTVAKFTKMNDAEGEDGMDGMEVNLAREAALRRKNGDPTWRTRLTGSMQRVWEASTARTNGYVSVTIDLENIVAYTRPFTPTLLTEYRSQTRVHGANLTPSATTTEFSDVEKPPPPPFSVLFVDGPAHFRTSFRFSPQRMVFQKQSAEAVIHLPELHIEPDAILDLIRSLKPKSNVATEPIGFSSSWMPMNQNISPSSSPTSERARKWTTSMISKRRAKKSLQQTFFAVLKGVEVNVPNITIRLRSIQSSQQPEAGYQFSNKGFLLRLQLSEAARSTLHQKWLGSSPTVCDAYSFTFESHSTVGRRVDADYRNPSTVLRIGESAFNVVSKAWPAPWMLPSDRFAGDPNASFVAIEIQVDSLEIAETYESVRWILAKSEGRSTRSKGHPTSMLGPAPRVNVDVLLSNISVRILDRTLLDTAYAAARCPGIGLHVDSAFRHPHRPTSLPVETLNVMGYDPVWTDITASLNVEPVSLTVGEDQLASNDGDNSEDWSTSSFGPSTPALSNQSSLLEAESVVLVGATEIVVNSGIRGHHSEDPLVGVMMDMTSALTQITYVTDRLTADFTSLRSLEVIGRILRNEKPSDPSSGEQIARPALTASSLLDKLPSGCSVHLAFPQLRLGVCGKVPHPETDATTARGLALKTALTFDYCYAIAPDHTSRLKERLTKAASRDRLGLSPDPIQAACAYALEGNSDGGRAVQIQVVSKRTTVRCVVDHHKYGWYEDEPRTVAFTAGRELDAHMLLRAPEVTGNLLIRRHQPALDSSGATAESRRVEVRIPRVSGRLDVHHIMCALAAVHALRQFSSPRSRAAGSLSSSPSTTSIEVRSDIMQVVVIFPAGSKLFARLTSVVYRQSSPKRQSVDCASACVWAPSAEYQEKWDELCRLTSWVVTMTKSDVDSAILATGKGARLRLPHRFIPHDLITDVSIAIKASKHLAAVIQAGVFTPMPKPPRESAKQIPAITIVIGCFTTELADDPFESKLNFIWRAGVEEQATRLEREEAFAAKVAAIHAAAAGEQPVEALTSSGKSDHVSPVHTVSIEDARERLDFFNSLSWQRRHKMDRDSLSVWEENVSSRVRDPSSIRKLNSALPMELRPPDKSTPLLRAIFSDLQIAITKPHLGGDTLQDFLHDLGGLPHDTQFGLLIPFHLKWTMNAFRTTLRDYPIPLLNIPESPSAWLWKSNLVIAEEDANDENVDWIHCSVSPPPASRSEALPMSFSIPKTIMPVKTYAEPLIHVSSKDITDFSWGVSYGPAIQEVMQVLDGLSAAPRDKSPPIGFWDKLRLILHWRVKAVFDSEVRVHVKGTRDPYYTAGAGAGFAFCFTGNTTITSGYSAEQKEIIQLASDRFTLAIPDNFHEINHHHLSMGSPPRKLLKVCVKLTHGIRLGLGFVFERACEAGCSKASCLGKTPKAQGEPQDSYAGFRSDFIHFSLSLVSPTRQINSSDTNDRHGYNIFHLTPKVFEHFFAWFAMFSSVMHLPIRQGRLYPGSRLPSPKFGRHLATIKYKLSLSPLFISHMYKQDSPEQWREGETGFVGLKAKFDSFNADLHQCEQAVTEVDSITGVTKTSTHKPFAAVRVTAQKLQLQAVSALFADPHKALVPLFQAKPVATGHTSTSSFPEHGCTRLDSRWVDLDDFNETDWTPSDDHPRIWMFQAALCPTFLYSRRLSERSRSGTPGVVEGTKFGDEDTHICDQVQHQSFKDVEAALAEDRIGELKKQIDALRQEEADQRSTQSHASYDSMNSIHSSKNDARTAKIDSLDRSLKRLKTYQSQLKSPNTLTPLSPTAIHANESFVKTSPDDLSGFSNVYELHSPLVVLSNSTRNILLDYYYSSSNRRAFEYHMSSRAIAFLREQMELEGRRQTAPQRPADNRSGAAARMSTALRRILTSENEGSREDVLESETPSLTEERKRHHCVLFKPQIALRCEEGHDSVVYVTAMEASLRSCAVMDPEHSDDPVNGYIMSRNDVQLQGLQSFVPKALPKDDQLLGVPLEVLLDYRCESKEYERLVPQTDATIQYDKFNRLRLHSTSSDVSVSGGLNESSSANEHMKYQTDRVIIDIPRFTVTANSASFSALQNTIKNLLLYSDPTHSRRNEALETFLFTYDFSDVSSAMDVVSTLQARIRRLSQVVRRYTTVSDALDEAGQKDALMVHAQLTSLGDELDFIFQAARLAQEKARNYDDSLASALQLLVSSELISWNMLGEESNLIAKLAVKGVSFKWMNTKDGSAKNVLTIKDLQALNGLPGAAFAEVLVAHAQPSNHPMVKRKLFAEATWTVLPSVAQIAVVQSFELRLHPIKVQIERRIGREIQEYISPKDKRISKTTISAPPTAALDPWRRGSLDQPSLSIPGTPRFVLTRAASHANLRDVSLPSTSPNHESKGFTLHKSTSTASLRASLAPMSATPEHALPVRKATAETAEMRVRAKKRTFLFIQLEPFLLILTYKGEPLNLGRRGDQGAIKARDFVPNVDEFPLTFPRFEHRNITWGIEDFLKDVKTELKKNAVGVVFRAVNARFSSKYRNHEDSAPSSSSVTSREDAAEGEGSRPPLNVFPSNDRTALLPPPMLVEQPPSPMGGEQVLAASTLTNSPPGQILLLPPDDCSAAPSDSDRPGRPRRNRVLSLFSRRHGKKSSNDTTISTNIDASRRQSTEM